MRVLSGIGLRQLASEQTRACEPGALGVWLLSTQMTAVDRHVYERVLLPDEQARARKFIQSADRDRSIVGREAGIDLSLSRLSA